jgi:hypothetical protein
VARALGGTVAGIVVPYVSSYIRGSITKRYNTATVDVLSHRDLALFTLTKPGTMHFIDDLDLRRVWPYPLMTPAELDADVSRIDPAILERVYTNDLRYWRPVTVGDVVFNDWD